MYDRFFNHRPFIKGEITHFVKEFETKRGDREVENLFETLEITTELQGNDFFHSLKVQLKWAVLILHPVWCQESKAASSGGVYLNTFLTAIGALLSPQGMYYQYSLSDWSVNLLRTKSY